MAGLFLIRSDSSASCAPQLAEAERHFALHGFANGKAIALPGWQGVHFPYVQGGPDMLFAHGDDLIAVAGTFCFDALMGRPALAAMLADWPTDPTAVPLPDWSRIGGHFTALVHKGGRSFLFGDYLAAHQLFHDDDRRVFSTSLLAATGALDRLSFDPQGVYEFAFNAMPVGNDTIFNELKLLGPDHIVELTADGSRLHPTPKPLPTTPLALPIDDRIDRHRRRLEAIVSPHVRQFGNHIHCPLSGGLDSRLVLALLRAAGAKPDIYVYGSPGGADVTIARAIGDALGFPVNWVDKSEQDPDPDQFAEQVRRNFHLFDATPTFGNIFDTGSQAAARDARHADGALAASGGCGEVFRDFFYLADRPTSAASVASAFYARFIQDDTTDLFDADAFLDRIGGKIQQALGLPDRRAKAPRSHIEQAYPKVRCRALFGREISLESRYGAYLMPFLDQHVVAEALTLPMRLKQVGRFETMLIAAIDPDLARQPSAYGHDFAGPPSRRHRFEEWSSRVRPIWLRRNSYAIQRRLRPMADEHGGLLDWTFMDRVIDRNFPAMRRFFHVDRIRDSGLWRRIACLEYFATQLGSKLAG